MKRDDKVYLQDILEAIHIIMEHIGEKTSFEFSQSLLLQDAVIRRFEIIGEATQHLSADLKSKHPEIKWKFLRNFRNELAHEYFGISATTIYQTIINDLPALKIQIELLLSQLNKKIP